MQYIISLQDDIESHGCGGYNPINSKQCDDLLSFLLFPSINLVCVRQCP